MKRYQLSLAALAAGLAMQAAPSAAQDAPALSEEPNPTAGAATQDIVVTAQRRRERDIDVPLTVTSLSADALEDANITNTRDLGQVAPGVNFVQAGGYTIVAVRGVSSFQTSPGAENNVAIYLDGAYLPSKMAGIFDLPDVGGIEILKGPQGTLWGRNATGGAILISTRKPGFETEGKATVGIGSLYHKYARGFVSVPLVDDLLSASLAASIDDRGAYLTNVVTGQKQGGFNSKVVRGKLRWTPSDWSEVILTGLYSKRVDEEQNLLSYPPGLTGGSSGFRVKRDALTTIKPREFSSRITDAFWTTESKHVNLSTNFETGIGDISTTTAYTDADSPFYIDATFTNAPANFFRGEQPETAFSQDLNYISNRFGGIQVLAGTSYYRSKAAFAPLRVFRGPLSSTTPILVINYEAKVKAMSAYLEADYQITDRLTLIGGARYTHERQEYFGSNKVDVAPFVAGDSWSKITPRAAIRYQIADNTNIYASYSQGFKSGTYNFSTLSKTSVDPETVDGFEVGIKSVAGRVLSYAVSAFYSKYKDIQVQTRTRHPTAPGVFQNSLVNGPSATVYGMDIDVTVRPVQDLTLGFRLSPLKATFGEFLDANVAVPIPLASCPPASLPAGCGTSPTPTDVTGNYLRNAPQVTGSFSVDYVLHSSVGKFGFNSNVFGTDGFYWDVGNLYRQPSYVLVNGRISWAPYDDERLTFAVWGKNLGDVDYTIATNESAGGVLWAPGRTVGVEATMEF